MIQRHSFSRQDVIDALLFSLKEKRGICVCGEDVKSLIAGLSTEGSPDEFLILEMLPELLGGLKDEEQNLRPTPLDTQAVFVVHNPRRSGTSRMARFADGGEITWKCPVCFNPVCHDDHCEHVYYDSMTGCSDPFLKREYGEKTCKRAQTAIDDVSDQFMGV